MTGNIVNLHTEEQRGEILQREIINYIFYKIAATWGNEKLFRHVGGESKIGEVKREWKNDFLKALRVTRHKDEPDEKFVMRTKEKIDKVFSEIRQLAGNRGSAWEWPCLRRVCSYIAAYREPLAVAPRRPRVPDFTRHERTVAAGTEVLANLKARLNIKSPPTPIGRRNRRKAPEPTPSDGPENSPG